MLRYAAAFLGALLCGLPPAARAQTGVPEVARLDRFVLVKSDVPALRGQIVPLYLREVSARSATRVVVFVHGATTPGEVAFDAPSGGYSWMEYLAKSGFDVFSVDLTGYGRSVRPYQMNDPCNVAPAQQTRLVPAVVSGPCAGDQTGPLTSYASDWHDLSSVVDFIRKLRQVDQVDIIAWSLGGPRAGGYAAANGRYVRRLMLLAPVYVRASADVSATSPTTGPSFTTQSEDEFRSGWNGQATCPGQVEPRVQDAVWKAILESDPVGASWGSGMMRAPLSVRQGWNQQTAQAVQVPTLLVSGDGDKTVSPERVRELYADLGSQQKLFVGMSCASHFVAWEIGHSDLFKLSLEWLTSGTALGQTTGSLRMGSD